MQVTVASIENVFIKTYFNQLKVVIAIVSKPVNWYVLIIYCVGFV